MTNEDTTYREEVRCRRAVAASDTTTIMRGDNTCCDFIGCLLESFVGLAFDYSRCRSFH